MLSERLFFITERITDILKLEEELEVDYSDDERKGILVSPSKIRDQRITKSIQELYMGLSRLFVCVRDLEKRIDEQQHDYDRFYFEIHDIANSSDYILNHVISCDDVNETYDSNVTVSFINHLVNRIHNFHYLLPSQNYYNLSCQQIVGSTTITIYPSHSRAPVTSSAPRPKSYGHIPNLDLVGFSHEIQTLLDHLTKDDETHVVGIVGMGGAGKTTLAKHIYHHPIIKTHFSLKIWVCISQSWDKTNIIKEIWRQAATDPKAATIMDFAQAVWQLYELLSSKSYLVILDDVWSLDAWYDISQCLPLNSGSKLVVTTRNSAIPKHIGSPVHIVELKPSNNEESWELFMKKAFHPNEKPSDVLLALGHEMVKKCHGLPLAIVVLADVLRMDKRESYWKRVSKRLMHIILKANNQSTQGVVKEVLAMTYNELPHHLKQCVLYLRLFPEDYEINARNLIQMWIAECLISTNEDEESTAQEYLEEIVQRGIVEVVKTNFMGEVSRIRIHDLTREMLVDLNKERGFFSDSFRLDSSAILYGDDQNQNFSSMSKSACIANFERVFLSEPSAYICSVIFLHNLDLSKSILLSMFLKFRLLRVLILHESCTSSVEIPEEIGNLIHLRYLELGLVIKQLPSSIANLRNLQTLNMRYGRWERRAEISLYKMKGLRHLYLPDDYLASVDMKKLKLEWLEKLKTLWNVRGGEWMLLGMIGLSSVLEELRVFCISSEEQLEGVFRTPCITSNNLQTLELDWYGSSDGNVQLGDMNILRECKSLRKLKLSGQIQASMGIIFPPNLIKLEMIHTCLKIGEVLNIISKTCPHLKILKFGSMAYQGEELVCDAYIFPKLEKLTLDNLENLKYWKIAANAMPSLHHLTIRKCPHLALDDEGRRRISEIPKLIYQ